MSADEKQAAVPAKRDAEETKCSGGKNEAAAATDQFAEEVNSYFAGKWFAPIIHDVRRLEMMWEKDFQFLQPVLADGSPVWSFNCLLDDVSSFESFPLCARPEAFGARQIGKLVGVKWVLIAGGARLHPVWKTLKPKQVAEIEAVAGEGFVADVIVYSEDLKERLLPVITKIRQRTSELAVEAGMMEDLEYTQGFLDGCRFAHEIAKRMRKPKSKRETDERKRRMVHLFGAICGPELEKVKGDASWPEVDRAIEEFFGDTEKFDEDSTKKILQRAGLSGVGKPGKPVKL